MEESGFVDQDEKNELSIMIEEESQELELNGFVTTASFSTVGTWIGGCASSGSSLSSAGD